MSYLTLNSINLNIPGAWKADRSLARLLQAPPKRHRNQTAPYVDGTLDFDQHYDQGVFDLSMKVFGQNNYAGSAHSSFSTGLIANLLYLRTNIFSLKTLMPAVLTLDGNGTLVADVQVANDVVADIGGAAVVTFDLIVPSGWFIAP